MRAPLLALAVSIAIGVCVDRAQAQLSPGELSRVHAELDSSRSCGQCHSAEEGVSTGKCLACHGLLGERIAAGVGLHSRPGFERCESCHLEHNGRDFELIWWGERGDAAFDHSETGFVLEGAHLLPCRSCHRASRVVDPERLTAAGKALELTFLGLDRPCTTCHADVHEAQMAPRGCLECHDETAWRPASRFDHERSGFALRPLHSRVACVSCHPAEPGAEGEPRARYRGLATACASCHRDPHRGRFGTACGSCHASPDWREVDRSRFDHGVTRFALVGRHRAVACVSCHPEGVSRIAGFEGCATCHPDVHLGQLREREDHGECSGCHDAGGFTPARFGLDDHAAAGWRLEGAHRKVSCGKCHPQVATAELVARGLAIATATAPASSRIFRFEATGCADCHGDPHQGSADAFLGEVGCRSCHDPADWRRVAFDHRATRFPLEGAHRTVSCTQCHPAASRDPKSSRLILSGASSACRECHRDPHLGQFDRPGEPVSCRECHSQEGWTPSLLDHLLDTRFPLEGKHAGVACAACHPREGVGESQFVRYRPVPTRCSSCHRQLPGSAAAGEAIP